MKLVFAALIALLAISGTVHAQTAAGQVRTYQGPSVGEQWILPSANTAGYATGVATFLTTPSSANLQSALTDETGTGSVVSNTSPNMLGHWAVTGAAPALTSCGTSPAIVGSDIAGEVTMGTGTPTGCVITFAAAYTSAPYCTVSWQTNIASMQYTISTTAITLVQTATSSNKVNYNCLARSGG